MQATQRRRILLMRRVILAWSMAFHSSVRMFLSWSRVVLACIRAVAALPSWSQSASMGFKSGEQAGQPFVECHVPARTGPQFLPDVVLHYHLER